MGVHSGEDLLKHVGHDLACVTYGDDLMSGPSNVAVECERCGEVLLDFDVPPERLTRERALNMLTKGGADAYADLAAYFQISDEEIDAARDWKWEEGPKSFT